MANSANWFDEHCLIYDIDTKFGNYIAPNHLTHLLSQYIDFEPNKILDVGTGTGQVIYSLERYFPKVDLFVGFDLAEGMLGVLKYKRKKDKKRKINLVLGDSLNLPFPDSSFDIVTCCGMLEYVEGYDRAIADMLRVSDSYVALTIDVTEKKHAGAFYVRTEAHIRTSYDFIALEKFVGYKFDTPVIYLAGLLKK